ncbi:hypothetical protein POM88_042344 [Heracleum sosnowskyi]|uniref:Uncharacterized protein n=1 Tax=Heracleum sosnowskyi TaxID=360622 RepID=A0AAD8MC48_9APIA|nr:hypothetical protein POM88_042344 [Heracleum sosnowskyi]
MRMELRLELMFMILRFRGLIIAAVLMLVIGFWDLMMNLELECSLLLLLWIEDAVVAAYIKVMVVGWERYGPGVGIRNIKPIRKGDEITIAYTDLLQTKVHFNILGFL